MTISQEAPLQTKTFDVYLNLKDAGAVTADLDRTTVDGSGAIISLGGGRQHATLILDISAIEVASTDEVYKIVPLFSNSPTHASGIVAGPVLYLGASAGIAAILDAAAVDPDTDTTVGRIEIPITNTFSGTAYEYMALSVEVSGTVTTGINFSAYVSTKE